MTRTLHTTLMALSTTGLLLVVTLLAASPLPPAPTVHPIVAASPQLPSRHAGTADAGEAVAIAAALLAATATEVAISAAVAEARAEARADAAGVTDTASRSGAKTRSGHRNARIAIALPYFSFARGLRRGHGG